MKIERIVACAVAMVNIATAQPPVATGPGEIFGGRVATEVTLPGECAGILQPAEGLPLRPALIKFAVSPDGQWMASSCEDSTGTHSVSVRRQGEAWRKINLPEKSPILRGWFGLAANRPTPVTATLALTDKGLWLVTFHFGPQFASPSKVANGALYHYPLPSGPVVKVFERPEGGQFGTFASYVVPSRDDIVVMQGFSGNQRRVIRVTPDGKSEFLPVPSGLEPLYAAPLGPNGDYVTFDGFGKAFVGNKVVTGLPQRESVLFAANNRIFVFPAGDNSEVWEILPNGTAVSTSFPATARPVQPAVASSAGLLMEGGGFLDSREFDTLYMGTTRVVRKGDVVLGIGIQSFYRHSTAIDDNGAIYFSPSGNVTRVFRLSAPHVPAPPTTAVSGNPIPIPGIFPVGDKLIHELVLGGSSIGCPNPTETALVCKPTDGLPAGQYRARVRVTGPGGSVSSSEWTLTVTPPPPPPVPEVTAVLSADVIERGQATTINWSSNTPVRLTEVLVSPPTGEVFVLAGTGEGRLGSYGIKPNFEGDFVYTLTFSGPGGTTTVQVSLKANRPKTQIAGPVMTMSGEEAKDPVLPGTQLRIYGVNLASRTCESEEATLSLCGTSVVTADGTALPVRMVAPGELVFVVPADWPAGDVWVTVVAEDYDLPVNSDGNIDYRQVVVAPRADPPPTEPEQGEAVR